VSGGSMVVGPSPPGDAGVGSGDDATVVLPLHATPAADKRTSPTTPTISLVTMFMTSEHRKEHGRCHVIF
jgi:hypothetical protein